MFSIEKIKSFHCYFCFYIENVSFGCKSKNCFCSDPTSRATGNRKTKMERRRDATGTCRTHDWKWRMAAPRVPGAALPIPGRAPRTPSPSLGSDPTNQATGPLRP